MTLFIRSFGPLILTTKICTLSRGDELKPSACSFTPHLLVVPRFRSQDTLVALRSHDLDDELLVRAETVHSLFEHQSVEVRLGKQRIYHEVPGRGR